MRGEILQGGERGEKRLQSCSDALKIAGESWEVLMRMVQCCDSPLNSSWRQRASTLKVLCIWRSKKILNHAFWDVGSRASILYWISFEFWHFQIFLENSKIFQNFQIVIFQLFTASYRDSRELFMTQSGKYPHHTYPWNTRCSHWYRVQCWVERRIYAWL